MTVTILQPHSGMNSALKAMRLPYGTPTHTTLSKDLHLGRNLTLKGDSHAKFARLMDLWLEITAPRFWWQEFDTYRMGVEKVSASTMNKLTSRPLTTEDFEYPHIISSALLQFLNFHLDACKAGTISLAEFKSLLPEGYLQTRIVKCSVQALHSMYRDRKNHRLPQWHVLFDELRALKSRVLSALVFEEEAPLECD